MSETSVSTAAIERAVNLSFCSMNEFWLLISLEYVFGECSASQKFILRRVPRKNGASPLRPWYNFLFERFFPTNWADFWSPRGTFHAESEYEVIRTQNRQKGTQTKTDPCGQGSSFRHLKPVPCERPHRDESNGILTCPKIRYFGYIEGIWKL